MKTPIDAPPCAFCKNQIDWKPHPLVQGKDYICSTCETECLASGVMVPLNQFLGEWDLYVDGHRILIED